MWIILRASRWTTLDDQTCQVNYSYFNIVLLIQVKQQSQVICHLCISLIKQMMPEKFFTMKQTFVKVLCWHLVATGWTINCARFLIRFIFFLQIVDTLFIGRYVLLAVVSAVFLVVFFMLLPFHFLEPVYAKALRSQWRCWGQSWHCHQPDKSSYKCCGPSERRKTFKDGHILSRFVCCWFFKFWDSFRFKLNNLWISNVS